MSDERQTRPWFAPKQIGYGATPITWEGWAATLGFVLVFALTAAFLAPRPEDLAHRLGLYRLALVQHLRPETPYVVALMVIEVAAFIAVARWKSSAPWSWRWGPGR